MLIFQNSYHSKSIFIGFFILKNLLFFLLTINSQPPYAFLYFEYCISMSSSSFFETPLSLHSAMAFIEYMSRPDCFSSSNIRYLSFSTDGLNFIRLSSYGFYLIQFYRSYIYQFTCLFIVLLDICPSCFGIDISYFECHVFISR